MEKYGAYLYEFINNLDFKNFHKSILYVIENSNLDLLYNDLKIETNFPNTNLTTVTAAVYTNINSTDDYLIYIDVDLYSYNYIADIY